MKAIKALESINIDKEEIPAKASARCKAYRFSIGTA